MCQDRDEQHQRVGVLAGIPMLGLDGLASAAYGPEAGLTILIALGAAGISYSLPLVGIIVAILSILYFSYRQTIAAYPTGGGSYTVDRSNLGTLASLVGSPPSPSCNRISCPWVWGFWFWSRW